MHDPTASVTASFPSLTRRELLVSTIAGTALGVAPLAFSQMPEIPTSSRELWQWVRTQPVLDTQVSWLDTATLGPTLRVAMASEYRAREIQSNDLARLGSGGWWSTETRRLAARFAAFVGCDDEEILFTRGTTEGLGTVAAGLDLVAGDEVITTRHEHPAALSPWLVLARRRGIVVRQVDLPSPMTGPEQALGLLASAITERTRVIAFSHVQYSDGALMPVADICQLARQRNILSVVDGAQAVGVIDMAVRDLKCDFYAAGFHKWLGGTQGTGFLYVRREMLDRLWPTQPKGLDAVPPVEVPTESPGHVGAPATLHKLGNVVPQLWAALRGTEAALDFQQQVNRSRIEARVRELAIYARLRMQQMPGIELLTPARPGLWAGILTFRVANQNAYEIAPLLAAAKVYVRDIAWPGAATGALRLSPGIFNTHDEIERLLQNLQRVAR